MVLDRAGLLRMEQHTARLPIAWVEGWSTDNQAWAGVWLGDLARLADVTRPSSVLVESLERGGAFSRVVLSAVQIGPPGLTRAGKTPASGDAQTVKGVADPPTLPGPTTASGRSPEMTSPSTITERVAEMRAGMAASPPNKAMDAFTREQAGLAASVQAGIAPAGTILPDAELLDVHGAATTLYAAAGDGTSVLVFYRGAWCPYCNIALSAYQDQLLPQLTERGIPLVAISPQKPDGSLAMQQKHLLAFTVVSDPGNIIAGRLGLLTRPSEEARAAQLQLGLDLTSVNADGAITLPMPATVILDATRTVRWIDVHPDYSTRTEPWQVIGALDHLEH